MQPAFYEPTAATFPVGTERKSAMSVNPVWIVDDDKSIRWVFEKALARENIAYRAFSSAPEALDALDTETPQVVVSDIRMPGESGLTLLQKVRERHATLPVIGGQLELGTWQSVCLVDTNVDNADRQVRLSFVG